MISSRASAASTSGGGPPAAIQPSFICGRPADLDSPPRLNVSASVLVEHARDVRARVDRVVAEHLVADEREAARGAERGERRRGRARVSIEPVGLFGLTTRTARVRAVAAASTAWMSIDQVPWYSSGYGRTSTSSSRVRCSNSG